MIRKLLTSWLVLLAAGLGQAQTFTTKLDLFKPSVSPSGFPQTSTDASNRNNGRDTIDANSSTLPKEDCPGVSLGDVVFINASGEFQQCNASVASTAKSNGVVWNTIAGSPQKCQVRTAGDLADLGGITDDAGLAFVIGDDYFCSANVSGKLTSPSPLDSILIGTAISTSNLALAGGGGGGSVSIENVQTTAPIGWFAVSDGATNLTMVATSTVEAVGFNSQTTGVNALEDQVLSADGFGATTWTFAAGGQNVIRVEAFDPTDAEPTGTTFVVIELGQDGAPSNAIGALISWRFQDNASARAGLVRRDSSDTAYDMVITPATASVVLGEGIAWFAPGTQQFEAAFGTAPTIAQNTIKVYGYVLEATVGSKIQNVVFLDTKDPIGDWIGPSVVTDTVVDLSDDGVPVGAAAALIYVRMNSSASSPNVRIKKTGEAADDATVECHIIDSAGSAQTKTCWVTVDSDRTVEAKFSVAWTPILNEAYVAGYALQNADPSRVTYLADTASALAENDVVYLDTTNNQVAKAQADTTATAKFDGIVKTVISSDQVQVQTLGQFDSMTDDAGSPLVPGTDYYVSANVSGAVTSTRPATFSVLVGRALTASSLIAIIGRDIELEDLTNVSATAPTTNDVVSFDADGNWTAGPPLGRCFVRAATDNFSTVSATFVTITGSPDTLSVTPGAGTYSVTYSGRANAVSGNSVAEYSIHSNGVEIVASRKQVDLTATSNKSVTTIAMTTIADGQAIDIRMRRVSGSGTPQAAEKSFKVEECVIAD